jgi:hypothetical protein
LDAERGAELRVNEPVSHQYEQEQDGEVDAETEQIEPENPIMDGQGRKDEPENSELEPTFEVIVSIRHHDHCDDPE